MNKPKTLLQQTMVLPLLKLGTLALRTICKPIANRLKKEAGVNPRFRQFIINIAQVKKKHFLTPQFPIFGFDSLTFLMETSSPVFFFI